MDIEVEGIVDVLVGGAERDADRLEHPSICGAARRRRDPGVGADHPDLGEAANTRITDKRAASRPIFERDSTRDAVILVMLKDREARFGRQAARQGGALVADGMAVTLLVGGDAGIVAMRRMGSGKTTSSRWGSGAGCMNALEARRGQGGRAATNSGSLGNDCVPDAPGGRIVRG